VLNDDAFSRFAGGLRLGSRDAFSAEEIHGAVQVAIGLRERAFTVHQPGVGHFPQFANGGSSNVSHTIYVES
jgi:hypothetical protein